MSKILHKLILNNIHFFEEIKKFYLKEDEIRLNKFITFLEKTLQIELHLAIFRFRDRLMKFLEKKKWFGEE